MKSEMFDRLLNESRYPDLKRQIELGDFRMLKVVENYGRFRTIYRFSNLSIFAPDEALVLRIFEEIHQNSPKEKIAFRSYGIMGMDITTK